MPIKLHLETFGSKDVHIDEASVGMLWYVLLFDWAMLIKKVVQSHIDD